MKKSVEHDGALVVLPSDLDEGVIGDVRALLARHGWSVEVSRGTRDTVAAVSGLGSLAELEAALPAELEFDLLPVRDREGYARLRKRRRSMNWMAWMLLFLIFAGLAFPSAAYLAADVQQLAEPEVMRAAALDELRPGRAKLVRFRSRPLWLVRVDEARYHAIGALCSQDDDCRLDFSRERMQVVCPCHGGAWDLYGNVVAGPASVPLRTYPVERAPTGILVRRGH